MSGPLPAAGKVCLVTGASSGVGLATACRLAGLGARVVMACRNRQRGAPALEEVRARSGNPAVTLLTADLESQHQVRMLAGEFRRAADRLDVLVLNAGLYLARRRETEDGIEVTWAVNHLAPFLLANQLLDLLLASAPARIVVVSSAAHRIGRLNLDDPELKTGYHWIKAYAQSKLANVLFTYHLAERLQGTGVTATCLHPGGVASGIWYRNPNPLSLMMRPLGIFQLSPDRAAEAVVRLAVSPELEGVTGRYFNRTREASSSRRSRDPALAERLWRISAAMTGCLDRTRSHEDPAGQPAQR